MRPERLPPDIKASDEVQAPCAEFVMAFGAGLGWHPDEVIAFAEALTGRRWEEFRPADFAAAQTEYLAIRRAIEAKRLRRRPQLVALLGEGHPGTQR
jgi:hypothetical protein